MADNNFEVPIGGTYEELKRGSSSGFNKDCAEFTPSFLKELYSAGFQLNPAGEEENLSTMGSALEELLAQVNLEASSRDSFKGYEETPNASISPSPLPSTAHITPQRSACMIPPPPGYDPIVEPSQSGDGYYDPYHSSNGSWRPPPPPFHLGFKLFVGALPYSVTEGDLFPLFSQFGEILELHIQRDWLGRSKGCAWLRYSCVDECDAAIEALHNNYYLGSMNRPMQLTYASDNGEKKNRSRTHSFSSNHSFQQTASAEDAPPPLTTTTSSLDAVSGGLRPRAMTDQPSLGGSSVSSGGLLSKLRMMSSAGGAAATTCTNSTRLEIEGIPIEYTDKEVENLFSQFGSIKSILVVGDRRIVDFEFSRDANRARETTDGVTLPQSGRPVRIL